MTTSRSEPSAISEKLDTEKLRRVTELVQQLRDDLKEVTFLPHERNAAMEQLKVFVRDAENAAPAYTQEGVELLVQHGFHSPSATTSRTALQALANVLLSGPQTRQMFLDTGYSHRAVARLKNPKQDDEFLMSRILFLTSYYTTQSFADLIDKHHLADYVNDNIARHAKNHSKLGRRTPALHDDLALSETLKLLFTVTHFCPKKTYRFQKSIGHIIKILSLRTISLQSPMQPPMSNLVEGLSNLFPNEKKSFPSKSESKAAIENLAKVLDLSLIQYTTPDEIELAITPLMTLLKRMAIVAPIEVRAHMKKILLPPLEQVCEQTIDPNLLGHRLLACMRTHISTKSHNAIKSLLYELYDQDNNTLDSVICLTSTDQLILGNNRHGLNPDTSYESSVQSDVHSPSISATEPRSSISSHPPASSSVITTSPAGSPVAEVFPRNTLPEQQPAESKPSPKKSDRSCPINPPRSHRISKSMSTPVVLDQQKWSKPRSQSASRVRPDVSSQLAAELATRKLGALVSGSSSNSTAKTSKPCLASPFVPTDTVKPRTPPRNPRRKDACSPTWSVFPSKQAIEPKLREALPVQRSRSGTRSVTAPVIPLSFRFDLPNQEPSPERKIMQKSPSRLQASSARLALRRIDTRMGAESTIHERSEATSPDHPKATNYGRPLTPQPTKPLPPRPGMQRAQTALGEYPSPPRTPIEPSTPLLGRAKTLFSSSSVENSPVTEGELVDQNVIRVKRQKGRFFGMVDIK